MSMFASLISNDQQNQNQPQQKPKPHQSSFFFCFNARQYFEVEEEDIVARIKAALTLRPSFRKVINEKPDLYGPFWIATTLIVIIVAASSLGLMVSGTPQAYNFNQISVAASLIYGICFGCPYIIALMVKIFGGDISVVKLICVYGYSLTSFIPITALCFLNSSTIQLIILLIGYSLSSVFLIRGILSMEHKMGEKQRLIIGTFILSVQLILVLMYKFYFF